MATQAEADKVQSGGYNREILGLTWAGFNELAQPAREITRDAFLLALFADSFGIQALDFAQVFMPEDPKHQGYAWTCKYFFMYTRVLAVCSRQIIDHGPAQPWNERPTAAVQIPIPHQFLASLGLDVFEMRFFECGCEHSTKERWDNGVSCGWICHTCNLRYGVAYN